MAASEATTTGIATTADAEWDAGARQPAHPQRESERTDEIARPGDPRALAGGEGTGAAQQQQRGHPRNPRNGRGKHEHESVHISVGEASAYPYRCG